MTPRTTPAKPRPSLWAVALLCVSSTFALASIVLAAAEMYP